MVGTLILLIMSCSCFSGLQKDPFLDLLEDLRLKVVASVASGQAKDYGTVLDDRYALHALAYISLGPEQTAEALVALIVQNSRIIAEVSALRAEACNRPFIIDKRVQVCSKACSCDSISVRLQLDDKAINEKILRPFAPVEVNGMGPNLYLEGPHLVDSPEDSRNSLLFEEVSVFPGICLSSVF